MMMTRLWSNARRHPLALGFVLIYALTWPIDLALAAQSQGRLPFHVPEVVGLLCDYFCSVAGHRQAGMVGQFIVR
jgi:hypothetical protein